MQIPMAVLQTINAQQPGLISDCEQEGAGLQVSTLCTFSIVTVVLIGMYMINTKWLSL